MIANAVADALRVVRRRAARSCRSRRAACGSWCRRDAQRAVAGTLPPLVRVSDSRAAHIRASIRRSSMSVARHPRPPELVDVPIEDIMQRYVGRFREKKPDWAAFEDAKIEGYKRAQHRFIGAGGSGKHDDPTVIPAEELYALDHVCGAGTGQRGAHPRGRGVLLRAAGLSRRVRRGRERQAPDHPARSLGMHRLPGGGHSRLSRTTAWGRSTSRSCSGAPSPTPWAMPTTNSTSAATPTSRQCDGTRSHGAETGPSGWVDVSVSEEHKHAGWPRDEVYAVCAS